LFRGCDAYDVSFLLVKGRLQEGAPDAHARAVTERAVWQAHEERSRWDARLPKDEHLVVPDSPAVVPDWPVELGFFPRKS